MQNSPTTHNDIATTYGPLVLSGLAIIVIAIAAFSHGIDWGTAINAIGLILTGNGLVGAVRWQAAPHLLADLQSLFGQLSQPATTETPTLTPPGTTPEATQTPANVL